MLVFILHGRSHCCFDLSYVINFRDCKLGFYRSHTPKYHFPTIVHRVKYFYLCVRIIILAQHPRIFVKSMVKCYVH